MPSPSPASRNKDFRHRRTEGKLFNKYIFPGGDLDYIGNTVVMMERHGFEVHDAPVARLSRRELDHVRAQHVQPAPDAGVKTPAWAFRSAADAGRPLSLSAAEAVAAHHQTEVRQRHSITSLARSKNDSEMDNPSAFAVVLLTTRSNLSGCSTGMSAGFAPRRILST